MQDWNYEELRACLNAVASDAAMVERFPRLAARLAELAVDLPSMIQTLDWDRSGKLIRDDGIFEIEALRRLGESPTSRKPEP